MDNPPSSAKVESVREVSAALLDLRDALVELSLTMRDLQFEADVTRRRATEAAVQKLLQKAAST